MDKRYFHNYLNKLKDSNPDDFALIESIQNEFEDTIECITDDQRRALRNHPLQFIARKMEDDGEWTTDLHSWAANGVPELMELDPMILAHKNGYGDTILMSLIVGATGAHTENVNYELIKRILETDLNYDDVERNGEDEIITPCNVLDIEDLNGQTVLDYLLDFAYATGPYEGQEPDDVLQILLQQFSEMSTGEPSEAQKEVKIVVHEKAEEESDIEKDNEEELQENNEDLDIQNYVSPNSSSTISSTVV